MNKILSTKEAVEAAKETRARGEKVILAGGCFDILHIGHIDFLENAKKQGGKLFVFLESDAHIAKLKGKERPVNTLEDRAKTLAMLEPVDFVIKLPEKMTNKLYDELVFSIKPDIIATTKGDPDMVYKKRQADIINGEVVEVIDLVKDRSTTRVVRLLKKLEL